MPTMAQMMLNEPIPEWLQDAPEDMDADIVQRHFEEAVILLEQCKKHFENDISDSQRIRELKYVLLVCCLIFPLFVKISQRLLLT